MKIRNFILIMVIALVFLTACGDTATKNDALQIDTEKSGLKPDLPDNVDMGGKVITFALLNWFNYSPLAIQDIEVEELTGEPFNDAAYNRNMYMEQTFNCVVKTVTHSHAYDAMPKIKNQITSGDNTNDIILFRALWMMPLLTGGYLHDLSDLPYVNLDNPWWNKSSIDAMSLGGRNYSLLGDYSMCVLSNIWLTYFNKDLLQTYNLENPYQLVQEGKWTLSKMHEMGKQVASDLNNDGKRDINDRFGVTHINDSGSALLNSFGERLVDIGADGNPYISMSKMSAVNKIMHIAEIFSDHETFFNAQRRTSDANRYEAGMFVNGRALFSLGGVYYGPEMRAMEQDFGLLPYPKYDEKQTEWYNPINAPALPLLTVPISNDDLDNMGIFIEAFTYKGYETIRPQFYDGLLQRKIARDNESEEMLDFIFNNIFFDIGVMYNFGNIFTGTNNLTSGGSANVASWLEQNSDKINREIEDFIDIMVGQ